MPGPSALKQTRFESYATKARTVPPLLRVLLVRFVRGCHDGANFGEDMDFIVLVILALTLGILFIFSLRKVFSLIWLE